LFDDRNVKKEPDVRDTRPELAGGAADIVVWFES
jgi:hypothetical protein